MNDNDKQGSHSDDREVELHVPYVLSDSHNLAIFPWDWRIPYLKLESKFRLLNSEVLPLSDDTILPTTSHMTSTLSLLTCKLKDKSRLSW